MDKLLVAYRHNTNDIMILCKGQTGVALMSEHCAIDNGLHWGFQWMLEAKYCQGLCQHY